MSELDRLWAGWRLSYIDASNANTLPADKRLETNESGTLFERLLRTDLPDEESFILARGEHSFAIMNAFPYTNGHLMVVPNKAATRLDQLTPEVFEALWRMIRDATTAVEAAYEPPGMNVGINIGAAGGAGVPDHIHVHVVPRWGGDTNFMTSVAGARVLPEPIEASWQRLRTSWPS